MLSCVKFNAQRVPVHLLINSEEYFSCMLPCLAFKKCIFLHLATKKVLQTTVAQILYLSNIWFAIHYHSSSLLLHIRFQTHYQFVCNTSILLIDSSSFFYISLSCLSPKVLQGRLPNKYCAWLSLLCFLTPSSIFLIRISHLERSDTDILFKNCIFPQPKTQALIMMPNLKPFNKLLEEMTTLKLKICELIWVTFHEAQYEMQN